MHNPRLAARYAKSLVDLAVEKDQLEPVYSDMLYLKGVCKQSRDFANLLKSPIIKPDKKEAIVKAVIGTHVGTLTNGFVHLLIRKGREAFLPEIIDALINQYKEMKGIHTIQLTTASPISEALKQSIVDSVKQQANIQLVELETAVREELIGGFVLQMGDTLVDASILYDLNRIKTQFMNNDFVHKIR